MPKVLGIIFLVFISVFIFFSRFSQTSPLKISPQPQPTASVPPKVASPTNTSPKTSKNSYTIAILGSSMVDTMGENLDYLQQSLKNNYPNTQFKLFNYGMGSQNVAEASGKFSQPFSYKTRNYPPINQIGADIIIVDSFAYNPLFPYDKEQYAQNLTSLVEQAKTTGARVYLLADIAPLKNGFGRGPGGIDWTDEAIKTQVEHIIEQLYVAIFVANSTHVPLINVFVASQIDGKYGNPTYVSTNDGIHPSVAGEVLTANIIASTIQLP